MSISIDTVRDIDSGVTTISLTGSLTYGGVPAVRAALLKCASECPTGVIVELGGLHQASAATLAVFATASHRAQQDWGVPLLLCGPADDLVRKLAPFRPFTTVCRTLYDALIALRTWAPRWVHVRMPNAPTSVSRAASLVGDACLAWGLTDVRVPARRVMSELVRNAVRHTTSDPDVMTAFTGKFLRLAVRDGSSVHPRLVPEVASDPAAAPAPRGRGLYIVRDTASHWGITPVPDGKIVWALLRTHLVTGRPVVDIPPTTRV
jgi:anti-anti-sigma regulatory factor